MKNHCQSQSEPSHWVIAVPPVAVQGPHASCFLQDVALLASPAHQAASCQTAVLAKITFPGLEQCTKISVRAQLSGQELSGTCELVKIDPNNRLGAVSGRRQ